MSDAQHAYSTDNPEIVAAFVAAVQARSAFAARIIADAEALGNNKGPLRTAGVLGLDRTVGLAPDDPENPPAGWRYMKSLNRLEPVARGKAGEAARAWLAAHQPSPAEDGRAVLEGHGLPRTTGMSAMFSSGTVSTPQIFEHDGTVWALYDRKPERECTWTPRKLSEFHAAREAFEADSPTEG
jgi:hypothetical protein